MVSNDRLEVEAGRKEQYHALMEEFIQLRTSTILPVLQQTRDILAAKNLVAIIKESVDGTSIKFLFCSELVVGDDIENSPNSNSINFTLDPEKLELQIEVRHASIPGEPPFCIGKPIKPGMLTKAVVEECVLTTLKRVIR